MTVHNVSNLSDIKERAQQNVLGETPLPFAPKVILANGESAVPQQYLNVVRNLENTEEVLSRIDFSSHYPLFAGVLNGALYVQVGIVGEENYPRNSEQVDAVKIVYGRRWMLEETTPTSEVVQTALLAFKKAREHELREKFVYRTSNGIKTTPFNNHMDLPLMVGHAAELVSDESRLDTSVGQIRLNSLSVSIDTQTLLSNGQTLLEVSLVEDSEEEAFFTELVNAKLAFVCETSSQNAFLHGLINELVRRSDRFIEENFKFDGFARFSQSLSPVKVAEFSYQTRNIKHKDVRFGRYFEDMSYQVDSSKAPFYSKGKLGDKQRHAITSSGAHAGYLPNEARVDASGISKWSTD